MNRSTFPSRTVSVSRLISRCVAVVAILSASLGCIEALAAQIARPASTLCDTKPGSKVAQEIHEEKFVLIGGIEQWVTINGSNCANPVVLIVHGGPGNPMTPYADAIYGPWAKQFTVVQWDQRGAGRTYGRNRLLAERDSSKWTPEQLEELPPLSIARLTQDGLEVASYAAGRVNQRKVILVGGSWGSALGVHMAKARPDLFHAYMGTGQMVHYTENELSTYETLLGLARAANDAKTVNALEALGSPPWSIRVRLASYARQRGFMKRRRLPRRRNLGGTRRRCTRRRKRSSTTKPARNTHSCSSSGSRAMACCRQLICTSWARTLIFPSFCCRVLRIW